ncbi:hypothetical protein TTHERM_001550949 (macronuclear) [Tetrahymena thermophila SB210]|uniref:Uncharacterized protein n=1 Tax=Tetrahymena thermophila (strain SB210) TaxID=312017 RepID=W7XFK0_TETTS|nr:hypothetical protein TTHERM_001550949 [Tetrahymena thermophila SB210]EWS75613.1 hypothetical protein TTHERM_001550949 [Tetrahymena thermophila SB210]|eukprot:XP_012651851.1 hypothetical protein TTHERM_001550949 [Tetrahymena thermophila SB210]
MQLIYYHFQFSKNLIKEIHKISLSEKQIKNKQINKQIFLTFLKQLKGQKKYKKQNKINGLSNKKILQFKFKQLLYQIIYAWSQCFWQDDNALQTQNWTNSKSQPNCWFQC